MQERDDCAGIVGQAGEVDVAGERAGGRGQREVGARIGVRRDLNRDGLRSERRRDRDRVIAAGRKLEAIAAIRAGEGVSEALGDDVRARERSAAARDGADDRSCRGDLDVAEIVAIASGAGLEIDGEPHGMRVVRAHDEVEAGGRQIHEGEASVGPRRGCQRRAEEGQVSAWRRGQQAVIPGEDQSPAQLAGPYRAVERERACAAEGQGGAEDERSRGRLHRPMLPRESSAGMPNRTCPRNLLDSHRWRCSPGNAAGELSRIEEAPNSAISTR